MARVAKRSGLGRESLYKALQPSSHPRLETILRVAQALSSSGFQGSSDPRLHLTAGAGSGRVLAAQVRWPGGAVEPLDPARMRFGQRLVVRRGAGVVSSEPLATVAAP